MSKKICERDFIKTIKKPKTRTLVKDSAEVT